MADPPEDAYWRHVRYVVVQMWGVCDGYNYAAKHFGVHRLSLEDMLLLNMGAELSQLLEALVPAAAKLGKIAPATPPLPATAAGNVATAAAPASSDPLDEAHWTQRMSSARRGSALVRYAAEAQDILVGHTTWDDYSKMTRIFKYYRFPLPGASTAATHVGFSSYPGAVSSTDDFYTMDSGIVVTQTSLEVLDSKRWGPVQDYKNRPRIPAFAHTMAVNRLATSGVHWARLMTAEGPSFYAAQWLAVDYNRLQNGVVGENTLWVVEMLPGINHAEDLSEVLRLRGSFPSFNRPYFTEIRRDSGHAAAEASHGDLYSWTLNPRAQLLGQMANTTNLASDMRYAMGHNAFPHSGLPGVLNGPGHDVASRLDVDPVRPVPHGAIDTKVVSRCLAASMEIQAASGPSRGNGLRSFAWQAPDKTELWPGWMHIGQPNVWNFPFVQMTPSGTTTLTDVAGC
eukprot:TRINITY_DN28115_c0_g1_i2.p1 TRINITY_DN28115_c0_g1~~TRINITY_DN28115_c0_g1_i2.p1  ORF type:complete len:455 (-),score=58.69 TRINITY_DN28115_c0_g1_i2:43-1407(-)